MTVLPFQTLKNMRSLVLSLLFLLTSLMVVLPHSVSAQARDCDANAVINCGAYSIGELRQKYNENQAGNVQTIFAVFGIQSAADFDGMVDGAVAGNGTVYVNQKVIATEAITAGRTNMSRNGVGSVPIADGAAYARPPSVSFANPNGALEAFVKTDENGQFLFAVIKSCGNPVKAKAVVVTQPTEKHPAFSVKKQVRLKDDSWRHTTRISEGQTADFRVTITNTGETDFNAVVLRDELPDGLELASTKALIDGTEQDANSFIGGNVVDTGPLKQGQTRIVEFSVKVNDGLTEGSCKTYVNTVHVSPDQIPEKVARAGLSVCSPVTPAVAVVPAQPAPPVPTTLPATGGSLLVGVISLAFAMGATAARYVYVTFQKA